MITNIQKRRHVTRKQTESVNASTRASCRNFCQPALRRKTFHTLEELQADLDEWLEYYNNERTHQGKQCCGRTPTQTLEDGKIIWKEKLVN
jgi:hypothetical protein